MQEEILLQMENKFLEKFEKLTKRYLLIIFVLLGINFTMIFIWLVGYYTVPPTKNMTITDGSNNTITITEEKGVNK